MTQSNWWKNAVAYQIYPKSYRDTNGDGIGDIGGIIEKLDYLKRLGIDVIWLSPIYKSPGYDNGYDISDYFDIDPIFGTLEDFRRLLSEAHGRNIKIIMDLVVNHSSDENPWFIESSSSRDNPKSDWYIWRDEPNDWKDFFSGNSAWKYYESRGQYSLHMFSEKQPDLNWECDELRKNVYSMMRYWLEMGVDGFRMDVISCISKPAGFPDGDMGNLCCNGARVHEFLKEMRREALADFDTMTVGEAGGVTVEEALRYANCDGSELSMVFHFEIDNLDGGEHGKWTLKKTNAKAMQAIHTKWQKGLAGKAWNSIYLSNHDQARPVSRYGDEGDLRERSAMALAACTYFLEGTPYIYYGEELGMTQCDFASPEELNDIEAVNSYHMLRKIYSEEETMTIISRRGRDGARTPMQWSAEPNAGFTDKAIAPWLKINPNYLAINASEQETREDSVLNFYRKLIRLRKSLDLGAYEPIETPHECLFAYRRGNIIVAGNLSAKEIDWSPQMSEVLLANMEDRDARPRGLRAYEAYVART